MIWPVCDCMDHAVYYNRPVKENYDYVSERILTQTMVTNSWNTLFNFTLFCIYITESVNGLNCSYLKGLNVQPEVEYLNTVKHNLVRVS